MSKEKEQAWEEMLTNRSDESRKDSFSGWLNDLEGQDQPTCNIENQEDCEACGS
jgi:hypothetical protein